jgi:hypothetical protein
VLRDELDSRAVAEPGAEHSGHGLGDAGGQGGQNGVGVRPLEHVALADGMRPTIEEWLSPSARAWRTALAPLTPAERSLVVDTLKAFEAALERQR